MGSGASGGAAGLLVPESHHGGDPPALVEGMARSSMTMVRPGGTPSEGRV